MLRYSHGCGPLESKTHLVSANRHTYIYSHTRGHSTVCTPTYSLRVSSPLECLSLVRTHWDTLCTSMWACSQFNFKTFNGRFNPPVQRWRLCSACKSGDLLSFIFFWVLGLQWDVCHRFVSIKKWMCPLVAGSCKMLTNSKRIETEASDWCYKRRQRLQMIQFWPLIGQMFR